MGKKSKYIVHSLSPRWSFLDGYSCNSLDEGHFIRHLGYRFKNYCAMHEINVAKDNLEIAIEKCKKKTSNVKSRPMKKYYLVDEYWGDYGYIIVVRYGDTELKKQFVSDSEALQWMSENC